MMRLYESYLIYSPELKSDKILNESFSTVANSMWEFITRYSPRNKAKLKMLKKARDKRLKTCHKYFTNKIEMGGIGITTSPTGGFASVSGKATDTQFNRCNVGANYEYAQGMLAVLKQERNSLCSKNQNKMKCQQWINKKIKKFNDDFQELKFAKRFSKKIK